MGIEELNARELRDRIAAGQVTGVAATEAVFEAIAKYEAVVGAYISTFREQALAKASMEQNLDRVRDLGVEYKEVQAELEQRMAEWLALGEASE